MAKFLEAYCDPHWAEDHVKIHADHADVPLRFDDAAVTLDLCEDHYRRVRAAMDAAMAVGTSAPQARTKPRRQSRAGQGSGAAIPQPSGPEADAIRDWVRAGQIMNPDHPDLLAFQQRGGGQYFPVWLLKRWQAEQGRQAGAVAV